ncbi:MAG TPA: SH3 domain-containing protein [Steroidobacteraceae bacterium]|nr:SH3 domain-containing protein [Steroidobacteraceae bacterium]
MNRIPGATALALLGLLPLLALAQEATTTRSANLRRDPSTASPVVTVLQRGARLTLVDTSADSGYYHVRTEDDQVGWVYARLLAIPAAPLVLPTEPGAAIGPGAVPAAACDSTLWNHVYHPTRLIVRSACVTVTGTLVDATAGRQADGVRHEADGDTHGWLRLDPQFQSMLNAGNRNAEGGNLVFEIICRYPVTQKDAQSACSGYTDHVQLPPVGSHVSLTGSYVQDTFHAQWNEIHPVSSVSVVP